MHIVQATFQSKSVTIFKSLTYKIKPEIMKRIALKTLGIIVLIAMIASCGSAKNTRKCDGRKGERTPMGLL